MGTLIARGAFATAADLIDWECDCIDLDIDVDAEMIESALERASDILARLSGLRFLGQKVVTLWRPSWPCRSCGPTCIGLPEDTVSVEAVWDNGVLLVEDTDYKVLGSKIHRTDSEWHRRSFSGQRLLAPHSAERTVAVSLTIGSAPGWMERTAALEVACDLISAWRKGATSALEGVTGISGGGVSITREPGEDEGHEAFASFPSVARFVAFWNPKGDMTPPAVYSPDVATDCGSCSCW